MAEILSRRRQPQHYHHYEPRRHRNPAHDTDMKSYITTSTGSLSTLTATVHEQMEGSTNNNGHVDHNHHHHHHHRQTRRKSATRRGLGEDDLEADDEELRKDASNSSARSSNMHNADDEDHEHDDDNDDARSVVSEVSHYEEYMRSKPSMSKANSRIVKLKKINDLQRANRALRDENATMKQEMREMKTKMKQMEKALHRSQRKTSDSASAGGGEEKMMDAIQALRAVTLKQEKKLRALKKERKDNNAEIADRDELIDSIQKERDAFKSACHLAQQECIDNQTEIADLQRDLASSIELVDELEDKLQHEHQRAEIASAELKEATAQLQTLEHRLEASKTTSNLRQSITADTPGETELSQIAKLQRELSTKIEHIVLLEFELEVAREELQELRDSRTMDQVFPALNAVEEEFSEEEFSDDDFDHPPQHQQQHQQLHHRHDDYHGTDHDDDNDIDHDFGIAQKQS